MIVSRISSGLPNCYSLLVTYKPSIYPSYDNINSTIVPNICSNRLINRMIGCTIESMNEPLNTTDLEPIKGKNGVLIDPVTRRFVKGGKPTTAIASPSQARELALRRYELQQEKIAAAVMREVQSISDIPIDLPEDAYAFVVGKQTIALVDSDKPRFDDVEKLGQLMGAVPRAVELRNAPQAEAVSDLSSALVQLVEFMSGRSRQTIDGEVIEDG